ncbi:MAG: hydroxyacylglutathione hydrolase [Phycisphaerae bacterium]|nr:hydroxyacylglutathione hydrolase [Phycisphaerae bacterium]
MPKPITLPALGDNYIYVLPYHKDKALVVDPGQIAPVLEALDRHRLIPTDIFVTHHHCDHTAAVAELKRHAPCRVIAPDGRIPGVDLIVHEMPVVQLHNRQVHVILTPGHTGTSVCFYLPPVSEAGAGILFTGDTLFVGGCGRVLETDMATMYKSIRKLAALPPETLVYPGHDYTEENYRFALTILPDDADFRRRLAETQEAQAAGRPTVPSTIAEEQKSNIFLRVRQAAVKRALNMPDAAAPEEVFGELRRRKDTF